MVPHTKEYIMSPKSLFWSDITFKDEILPVFLQIERTFTGPLCLTKESGQKNPRIYSGTSVTMKTAIE